MTVASIQKVLNLNHDINQSSESHADSSVPSGKAQQQSALFLDPDGEPIWKVLVFDNLGRDVISSVLRVNDLRALGVTIHL